MPARLTEQQRLARLIDERLQKAQNAISRADTKAIKATNQADALIANATNEYNHAVRVRAKQTNPQQIAVADKNILRAARHMRDAFKTQAKAFEYYKNAAQKRADIFKIVSGK